MGAQREMLHEGMRVALVQPRENERASFFRNAIGSVPQPWQLAEHIDDGRRAKCSPAPCRQLPLERHQCQIWVQCYIARCLVNVLAEALGCSFAPGIVGPSGLPKNKKLARSGPVKGLVDLSTMFNSSTLFFRVTIFEFPTCYI